MNNNSNLFNSLQNGGGFMQPYAPVNSFESINSKPDNIIKITSGINYDLTQENLFAFKLLYERNKVIKLVAEYEHKIELISLYRQNTKLLYETFKNDDDPVIQALLVKIINSKVKFEVCDKSNNVPLLMDLCNLLISNQNEVVLLEIAHVTLPENLDNLKRLSKSDNPVIRDEAERSINVINYICSESSNSCEGSYMEN